MPDPIIIRRVPRFGCSTHFPRRSNDKAGLAMAVPARQ
jgi:hypothetical protein